MKKIIRTANLIICKKWLIGGQIDFYGNQAEGFHSFIDNDCNSHLKINGKFQKDLIKHEVETYLLLANEDYLPFLHYEDQYRFRLPTKRNLNILVNRIYNDLMNSQSE